jgi:N-acylneuraminate cytidylyltransferase
MSHQIDKCIAIIPARGGSKRIPHKNILNFFDKPMIAWTIEAALESNIFDRILVSTDSLEVANVAKNYGVEVPFLRSDYVDDHSPVSMATLFALNQVKSILKEDYTIVAQLMANCPLRNSADIVSSYQNFKKSDVSSQISCFKYGWMNPWWAVKLNESGSTAPLFPEQLKQRSQDLPTLYCPTGAIWLGKVEDVLRDQTFYSKNHIFYPIDWMSAVDIDDMDDLAFAKAVYAVSREKKPF